MQQQLLQIAPQLMVGHARVLSQDDELDPKTTAEMQLRYLFDTIIKSIITSHASQHVPAELARLLEEFLVRCPDAIPMYRPLVQRLCEELPTTQTMLLWHLLVRLRAT